MSTIPAAYLEILQPVIETARQTLERGESLAALALVGNLAERRVVSVPLRSGSDEEKDAAAVAVRRAARQQAADFVLLVMEAWSLPPEQLGRADAILDRYGSIGASPHAIDVVTFTLETVHGVWIGQAPIKRKGVSKRKRTFGEPEFQHSTEVAGRFVDLLPEPAGGGPAATLH